MIFIVGSIPSTGFQPYFACIKNDTIRVLNGCAINTVAVKVKGNAGNASVSNAFLQCHISLQLHGAASLNSRHSCFQRGYCVVTPFSMDNCFPICHLHGKIAVFTLHGTEEGTKAIW